MKALIVSQHEQWLSHQSEIEHLKLLIAKLRRMQFGRKSEKLERQIEQLEFKLEELQSEKGLTANAHEFAAEASSNFRASAKPARQPLPEHLPREVKTYVSGEGSCRNAVAGCAS